MHMNKNILLFLLLPLWAWAQLPTQTTTSGLGNNRPQFGNEKDLTVEGEKPPITDYLIISQDRDTTFVDTTLTMAKDYKYNYLRRDDFELMPFHNIGRPYNSLGRNFDFDLLSPRMGARARHFNYIEIEDVLDYHVPTPLTELYFKTVVNQGQQLDALFTTNVSPGLNFSLSYKGLRSAGNYVNTLTSTGNFKFTTNYVSKNQRYRLRLHTVFQDNSNQENGGLDPESLEGFVTGNEDLQDRGRLEPNLTDATSFLEGKRYYLNHDYEIIGDKDSTSYYSARIYNTAFYEDKLYRFEESTASNSFLGDSYVSSSLRDQTDLEQGAIEAGITYDHYILGYFKAGIVRQEYNYGYNRTLDLGSGNFITNRLKGELYQFKGAFEKRIGKFDINVATGINVAGDLDGQYLNGSASYKFKDVEVNAGIAISSRAPDFNYQLFQSDYVNYNWQNSFSNIEKQQLSFNVQSEKYLDLDISFTTLQDYVYFEENQVLDTDNEVTGYNASPVQALDDITYLKIKAHKDIRFFRHFGIDNTVMFQSVSQGSDIINVPEFTTRNSLYYKDRLFKNALLLQTGITLKYFSSYYMDSYDPVLGEFTVQTDQELGAFPMVDVFVNAKVRQTRIFFKLEHLNQLFASGDDYFSAPRTPYRDFTVRFGVVWNFFL